MKIHLKWLIHCGWGLGHKEWNSLKVVASENVFAVANSFHWDSKPFLLLLSEHVACSCTCEEKA